jgi:uncharacterized protein
MEFLTAPFEVKANDPGTTDGIIVGYASTFDSTPDSYGDVVAKGAFKKTLEESKSGAKAWPAFLLQHGDDTSDGKMPIGLWLDMSEDEHGLKVRGKFANTKRARDAYELLKMKPRAALNGLSIGFRARNYTLHKSGPIKRTLTDIDLAEVSLVTFPADRFARVIGVKSYFEPKPEMTMRDLARSDYEMLCRTMTMNNRNWR